jgi:hypothetical protein
VLEARQPEQAAIANWIGGRKARHILPGPGTYLLSAKLMPIDTARTAARRLLITSKPVQVRLTE